MSCDSTTEVARYVNMFAGLSMIHRNATIEDLQRLRKILEDGIQSQNKFEKLVDLTDQFLESQLEKYKRAILASEEWLHVMEDDNGVIVGYVWACSRADVAGNAIGQVAELVVESSFKRQGYGTRLFGCAKNWFTAAGLAEIEVNYSVASSEARHFWKALGFEPYFEKRRLKIVRH